MGLKYGMYWEGKFRVFSPELMDKIINQLTKNREDRLAFISELKSQYEVLEGLALLVATDEIERIEKGEDEEMIVSLANLIAKTFPHDWKEVEV